MAVDEDLPQAAAAAAAPQTAGAMLAAAREAAGLTVDAVAAQLKLAPRQVRALEDGDFAALPGRTFVRGFARNYARFLAIDADTVLAALPDAGADPGLSHPHLASTQRAMGEIPAERVPRKSFAGWAIALALAAIVVLGIVYEKVRAPSAGGGPASAPTESTPAAPPPGTNGKSLPNPAAPAAPAPADANTTSSAAPAQDGAAGAMPASAGATTPPATMTQAKLEVAANAPAAHEPAISSVAAPAATTSPATPAAGTASLAIAFRGTSWIEVKDASGASLLTMTGSAGTARSLDASPPLDLVVGNAGDVDIRFRGQAVDLAPYIHQNVARLTLR